MTFFCNFAACQICITTSTSAGLEQTLPWIFYHKVIGVSTFLLFVEGKAASPDVSKVLETIPVSLNLLSTPHPPSRPQTDVLHSNKLCSPAAAWFPECCFTFLFAFCNLPNFICHGCCACPFQGVKVIYRTRELEEQQAKRSAGFFFLDVLFCEAKLKVL